MESATLTDGRTSVVFSDPVSAGALPVEYLSVTIEGDLRISAIHNGHVEINSVLWEATMTNGWRVEAKIQLEAGEQLSRAAAEVSELVGGSSNRL